MSIYDVSAAERKRRAQEMARMRAMVRVNTSSTAGGPPSPAGEGDEEKGFWASAGDFFGNILKGALKGIEGIWDFGASVVGEVGGWFDEGFKEDVREHVEYDFTGAATDPWLKDLERQSYLGEDSFVRSVGQGIGGMLPAVVTGGVGGALGFAGGAIGTGTMMLGAAGQGTEEAMKSGAGYGSALAYGTASGLVEGATEKLGGFAFGGTSKLGKAVAGTRLSHGLGKVAFDAASEGAEEVLADYIDPALKYATGVDKNIGGNYLEAAKNTGKTFLTGAAVGSIMQGGQNILRNSSNKSRGGAHATRADDALRNVIEATEKYNGAANNDFKYDKTVKYNLESMAKELGKMSPEARKNYLDSIGIYKNAFDRETGKLKENSMPYAHREAITANLRTFSGNLSHKPLTGGENITNGAKTAKKTVERVVGHGAAVVVTNELGAEDRAIYNPDDGVIYINNNADLTEKDVANAVALHEVTHTTEGTKAYTKLVEQIEAIANDKNAPESVKKIVGDITLRRYSTATSYEAEMEGLSKEQSRYLVDTEVSADLIGDLLSNDYFIEKLAERDMGLLEKLYHSFKNRANAKKSELGPEGIKYLKKLASKFGTAIEKRANYVQLSQNGDDKEEKEVESASNLRYNKDKSKAKIARYIPYSKIGTANVDAIRRKLQSIYAGTDNTVADGIAIEHGNKIYIVDSGKENGKIDFGVRKAILISNPILRQERQEKINERAISNGFISSELFGQFKRTSNNSGRSGVGRKLGEELSFDTGKSQDNQGRVPDENGDRGRGVNSTERKSKIRSYDPKNGKEPTFEAVPGGVKINFNDFDTNKSNDNSNDLVSKGSSDRENEAWGYEAAEKARRESLDSLLEGKDAPRRSPVSVDNNLLRRVVDNTKAKKYTRKEMSITIDEILSQDGYFGDNIVSLKGKKRAEAEKILWRELNTKDKGELGGAALKVADYIIQNAIATEYIDVTDDVQLAVQFIDAVKPYLHNMNLEAIKGDIQTKFDKDRSPFLMWSVKKNSQFRGYTADEVKQELEALGLGYNIDKTNEADIFLEIDELYRAAKQTVIDATPSKQTLFTAVGYKEFKDLRQKIAKDILKAQEEKGTETTFYKIQQKYIGRIEELSEKVRDLHRKETLERQILKEIKKIEESKSGKYFNSTQIQMDALQALKGKLKGLDSQEQVNRSSTRDIMATLADWYTEDNPVLKGFEHNGKTNEQTRFFSKQIYELIQYFKGDSGNASLTMTELRNIRIVLHHMNFIFEHYGQIWRGNRYVDAKDVATELIESLKIAEKSGVKITTNMISKFFMDPMAVLAEMDGHDPNGFFTTTYKELAEGIVKQKAYEIEILEEFEAFRKANKKYMKSFIGGKDTIKMIGRIDRDGKITSVEVPKYAAIDLYMVSKTGNALQTLEETGWRLVLDGEHVQGDFQTITKEQLDALYKQFSAKDKELISIIEKAYNGKCRDLKYETDMRRLGFTNVFEGYYYPIRRTVRTDFDSETYWAEMERVSNISANKSRVKGVKNEIIVSNAITKFFSHVNAISRYSALSIPVENMSVLYNIDTLDNPRKPTSVKTTITQSDKWKGAEEYLFALAEDAQAMRNKMSRGTAAYQYLRGAYSGFALGFNPKTLLTQVSSYIAGFGELRFSSLTKGLTMIGKIKDADLDKYCPWAKVRHYERGVIRAESQTEKIGKISGFFSKGMEFVDRKIIKLEFAACQYEAKARFGLEIGTEENLIKAGELLTEIGLKTQQNQLATEKSAAMRSDSELWKTATMFKSDSMKLLSRMAQNISACISVKRQIRFAKAENNLEHLRTLEARYKEAKKHVSKYLAVIISSSVYMVLIARMFDKLYGKADEEENEVLGFCEDIGGNIAGMVPIVADLYNFFVDGYEVESFAYGMINDVLGSAQKIFQISGDLMSGKNVGTEKVATAVRNVIYAATQLVGIPTRNAYKVVRGAVGLVSDSGGVSMDAWFKQFSNTEVTKQLKTAIETGDESLTEKSLEQLYRNYDVSIADKLLKAEMDRLIKLDVTKDEDDENNYSPLDFKIPDNLEIDGENVELSAEDRKVFKNGLKSAEKLSAAMVKTYYYKKLGDEYRAFAIRKVFEYYDLMSRETVGAVSEERARLLYYGEAVGIDVLAVLMAYKKELNGSSEEEKAKRKQSTKELVIEYLKKFNLSPVQKSLVLRALGYSDKERDELVKSFINRRPGLSKEQKAEFLEIAKVS